MIKKVGRPKKPENEKVKYQRVAISTFAYDILKSYADKDDITLVEIIDGFAEELIKRSNKF